MLLDRGEPTSMSPITQGTRTPKPRASRAGTRCVSMLTPAELEKKRASDRKSQKTSRRKTKAYIEKLEAQIAELLANREWAQEKLEFQNAELRPQLRSAEVLSCVGDGNGMPGRNFICNHAERGEDLGDDNPAQQCYVQPLPADDLCFGTAPLEFPLPTPHLPQTLILRHGSLGADEARTLYPPLPISSSPLSGGALDAAAHWHKEATFQPDQSNGAERTVVPDIDRSTLAFTGVGILLESNVPHSQSQMCIGAALVVKDEVHGRGTEYTQAELPQLAIDSARPAEETTLPMNKQIPLQSPATNSPLVAYGRAPARGWELPILNTSPTCLTDDILLNLIQNQRQLAAAGRAGLQLIGPEYPNISSLLDPGQSVQSHPVCRVLMDIIGGHPGLSCLPEKVAVLYSAHLLLRWQILPAPQTYDVLPEWLCPRASQLVTPHPIWMDQVPWPRLRDQIINDQETYSTSEFQDMFTRNICVNWLHQPMDALAIQGDEIRVSPTFERHIRKLDNWSLGQAFAERYPELMEAME